MKKHWLRGILLGVSLALLLGGGVALGINGQLSLTTDQMCFQCCQRAQVTGNPTDSFPPKDDECVVDIAVHGYAQEALKWYFGSPCPEGDKCLGVVFSQDPPKPPPTMAQLYAFCDTQNLMWLWGYPVNDLSVPTASSEPLPVQLPFSEHGEYSIRACAGVTDGAADGDAGCDDVNVFYLSDCSVLEREEFVPEPGTLVLLGSGLMGLAGYATLRWRTRE